MKVRVIQHHDNSWQVEKRIVVSDGLSNFNGAKLTADRLKNPTILEIQ